MSALPAVRAGVPGVPERATVVRSAVVAAPPTAMNHRHPSGARVAATLDVQRTAPAGYLRRDVLATILILHAAWPCFELSVRWNEVERRWNAFPRMGRLPPNRRVTR